jgi:hypothetical protein
MPPVSEEIGLEKLLRPLGKGMSVELARSLSTMKADRDVQARYDTLARRANDGTLSELEKDELESLVRANTLVGLLKAEAHLLLKSR